MKKQFQIVYTVIAVLRFSVKPEKSYYFITSRVWNRDRTKSCNQKLKYFIFQWMILGENNSKKQCKIVYNLLFYYVT